MRRLIPWLALLISLCLSINAALSEKIQLDSNLLENAFRSLLGNMEMRRVTEADQERIVTDLKALGIVVPTEIVEEYNAFCGEADAGEDADSWSIMETPQGFARSILMLLGEGDYDPESHVWTPSDSGVYSFDAEADDIDHMYGIFLQGVSSIVPGFDVSEVTESFQASSPVASFAEFLGFDSGRGKSKQVSFAFRGHVYEKQLAYQGDWFNDEAIDWINEVLAQEGFDGRLHAFFDGYQGMILIYGNQERADHVAALLGW